MINKSLLFIPFLFSNVNAHHTPPPTIDGNEKEVNIRLFKKHTPKTSLMFEYKNRDEIDNRSFKAFKIGGYYRLIKKLKLGLFAKRSYGNRHDEDWLEASTDDWFWGDTNDRGENSIIVDATYSQHFSLLGSNFWVAKFKSALENNFFNDNLTLKLRPEITRFIFYRGEPLFNIFLRYEAYLALNFSEKSLYENWIYLGGLYHYDNNLKLGAFVAKREITWTTNDAFKLDHPGESYEQIASTTNLGLNLIYIFD